MLIAVLSVVVATLFIVHTYSVFSQTFDEGEHLAAGMEWLDTGSYSYDPLNPPLSRVAVALGPYLAGARSQGNSNVWNEGNAILAYQGHYQRTLTLARLGILPFFWLTCFVLWRFMVRYYGCWPAALAVVFFAFCPPVLANASVATTDLAFTAMFFCAFLCFWNFLQAPKLSSAVLAGLTVGLALLCKLSGLSYLAIAGAALYIYCLVQKRPAPSWKYLGVASLTLVLVIWAGYRFSVGPILHEGQVRAVEAAELSKLPPPVAKLFFFRWVPAPEFFKGLAEAFRPVCEKTHWLSVWTNLLRRPLVLLSGCHCGEDADSFPSPGNRWRGAGGRTAETTRRGRSADRNCWPAFRRHG